MKLNQRELELKILKCLISFDDYTYKASEKGLEEHLFLTKEPGGDVSLTGKLFTLCQGYAASSGGCKLTETVLESILLKNNFKKETQAKFLKLWYEVEDSEVTEDDFPHLVTLLKERFCVKLLSEMTDKNTDFVSKDQIKEAISTTLDYVNKMSEELDEFGSDKIEFAITDGPETFFDEFDKRLENPDLYKGIGCGLSNIDEKTFGWMPSQLIVVLAPSGGGKSVQMLNWAHYANTVCKKNILYFSFEMSSWLCMLRHTSLIAEIDYAKLKSVNITPEEKQKVKNALENMSQGAYFEYVVSIEDPSTEFVEQKIREITQTKGKPDMVVCDYIGNMSTRLTNKSAKSWEKNGDAAVGLHSIAKRYNIPVLTAQQITKEAIKENRKNKQAGKSISFEQDASAGDKRLIDYCTYAIGIEPIPEDNMCWYYPVKMRDALFYPFAAKVIPEFNKVQELNTAEQQILNVLKSADVKNNDKGIEKPSYTYEEPEEVDMTGWNF